MRTLLSAVALSTGLLLVTGASANDLCRFIADHVIGCPKKGCGTSCGCACEVGCDVGCACETGCCEPACGCDAGCGIDGRQFAGQTWDGCCQSGPRLCACVDANGNCCNGGGCCPTLLRSHGGGCGDACGCEVGCGAEVGCGCEVGCGADVACGCNAGCGPRQGKDWFGCGLLAAVGNHLCPCGGCSSEMYWSEWHNDPPRCQDPCDRCGNWVGPSAGYRAPYDHPYAAASPRANQYYAAKAGGKQQSLATVAHRAEGPKVTKPVQRTANRPYTGPIRNFQR